MNLSEQVKRDQEEFLKAQEARLARAGEFIKERIKQVLDEQGSKDHHAAKGRPPLKQSGDLINSIKIRVNGNEVEIYSDSAYGKYLERDHPWFLATIKECEPEVRKIIFGEM